MRLFLVSLGLLSLLSSCIDPLDPTIQSTVNVVVVEATITNLAELQLIRLSRSKPDSISHRYGTLPIGGARVIVVIDSSIVVTAYETSAGTYQLPSDFKGQIGHAYQLRFTLADGTRYASTQQVMLAVPPVAQLKAEFTENAISPAFVRGFTAGHTLFVDVNDPGNTPNYYRWEWTLYEPQTWCRTCYQAIYVVNQLEPILPYTYPYYYRPTDQPYEGCFYPPRATPAYLGLVNHQYDYPCRSQCWEIIHSYSINVFSDKYTNGNPIIKKSVAHIPYYQTTPCVVHIRQESISKDAFDYFDQLQQQTEKVGGVADLPPTILGGNVHNTARANEVVVGYFSASAVALRPYYLDRKDARNAKAPGLFFAFYSRAPITEGATEQAFILNTVRPPTALCAPLDQRTPVKPLGWQ
jgi:hypothetical protein